ncbi:MAG: single-stranded DNA-binding protein [Patescibacteria group bacterium]
MNNLSTRSLNKVMLIGNLTRDPELRYTSKGTAVCSFGLATNRSWTTDQGEKKEDVSFHRIVSWDKLAEICSQLLFKGRKVYVEGRLQTRRWEDQEGNTRQTTEVVISEMMILDSRRSPEGKDKNDQNEGSSSKETKKEEKSQPKKTKKTNKEKVDTSDIPF